MLHFSCVKISKEGKSATHLFKWIFCACSPVGTFIQDRNCFLFFALSDSVDLFFCCYLIFERLHQAPVFLVLLTSGNVLSRSLPQLLVCKTKSVNFFFFPTQPIFPFLSLVQPENDQIYLTSFFLFFSKNEGLSVHWPPPTGDNFFYTFVCPFGGGVGNRVGGRCSPPPPPPPPRQR